MQESSGRLAKAEAKVRFIFLFLGIASLTAFNATLSELFFFQHFLKNHNPGDIFTSVNNGFNLSILITFQIFGAYISYTKQLILFQILGLIALISYPFVVIYVKEIISYYICCILFAFIGISNALANSSVFAVVSFFPKANIVNVGIGQGLAGIISNVLNFIVLFIFGSDTEENIIKSAYTFFFISAGILVFSIFLTISLFRNEFFLAIASKHGIIKSVEENSQVEAIAQKEEINDDEQKTNEKEEKFTIIGLMKKIFVTAMMMFLLFSVTFLVFPGAVLKPELFNLPAGIKINLILLTFNIFDTVGRTLSEHVKVTLGNLLFISLSRILLVASIYYTAYQNEMQEINKFLLNALVLINPALLALTNGCGSSLAFVLAPTQVIDSWKGRAGVTMSLFLCIGLFVGSLASLKFMSLLNFKGN